MTGSPVDSSRLLTRASKPAHGVASGLPGTRCVSSEKESGNESRNPGDLHEHHRSRCSGRGDTEMKLEVVVTPVSEVDRAKEFYGRLGWRLDAHGEHEKRTGQRDAKWPDWYSAYMVAEQAGEERPQ